jgi:hypothetical protein
MAANRRGKVDQLYDFEALKEQDQKVKALLAEFVDHITKVKPIVLKLEGTEKITEMIQGMKAAEQATDKTVTTVNKAGAEYTKLLDQAKNTRASFEQTTSILEKYNGTLENNAKIQQKYKDRLAEVKAALDKLSEFKGIGGDKIAAEMAKLTAEQNTLKQASSELQRTMNAQAKLVLAESGSYDELNQTLGLLRNNYRQLAAAERESATGQDQLKSIKELDAKLKELDASMGNFQRNVGNYAGSLAPAFKVVGDEIAKLKVEQQGLQNLSQRDPIGFQVGGADRLNQVNAQLKVLEDTQRTGFQLTGQQVKQVQVLETAYADLAKTGESSEDFLHRFNQALQASKPAEYSGKFKEAFGVLKASLADVREKLKDPALQGADLVKLQQREASLAAVTGGLTRAFGSTREEMRAFQEAAVKLGIDLGAGEDVFQEFTDKVGESKDQIEDLKGIIDQKSSDSRFLDSAIEGVSALAGAYGAVEGSAALLGDQNEDLQKTMVELQSIMTIVNGLQAVQNALQEESAFMQGVLAAKTNLLNAAKTVEARLFGTVAAAQVVGAVAAEANAAANQTAAVAQGEAAVGAEANTAALEVQAVASGAATTATFTLRSALIASGIGAILVGLAIAAKFLFDKFSDWSNASSIAAKKNQALAESVQAVNDAIGDQVSLIQDVSRLNRLKIEQELADAERSGKSQAELLKIRKKLADFDREAAKEAKTRFEAESGLDVTQDNLNKVLEKLDEAQKRLSSLQRLQASSKKDDDKGEEDSGLAKKIDAQQAEVAAQKSTYDQLKGLLENQVGFENNANNARTDIAKFDADERRRLALETASIESDYIKSKNDAILSSDRSTLEQRLDAIKSNAEAQRTVIRAQQADVLNNPGSSNSEKLIAIKKAAAEERKLNAETKRQLNKENEEFYFRDLVALNNINRTRLEQQINLEKDIAGNQIFSFAQRKQALEAYLSAERSLLDEEYALKLKQAGFTDGEINAIRKGQKVRAEGKRVTDAELLAMQKNYENSVLQLTIQGNDAAGKVIRDEFQKRAKGQSDYLEAIQRDYALAALDQSTQYAKDVVSLNESLGKKEISVRQYNEKRAALDGKYQQDTTKSSADLIQAQLKVFEGVELKKADAEGRRVALSLALSKASTDEEKKAIAAQIAANEEGLKHYTDAIDKKTGLQKQLTELTVKEAEARAAKQIELEQQLKEKQVDLANQTASAIFEALSMAFDAERDGVQTQIDDLDRKANKEKEVVAATIANAEDREKATKEIDARTLAQREALEKKKSGIEVQKAKFEKIASLFEIGINTVKEVAKIQATAAVLAANPITAPLAGLALAQIPVVVASSAIAAALVAAKPIPKYATGTERHPGGLAIVGDAGVSEYAVTPAGDIIETPAVSTLMDLPTGTKVFKDELAFLSAIDRVNMGAHERALASPGSATVIVNDQHWNKLAKGIDQMRTDVVKALKNNQQPPSTGLRDWVHS